MRTRERREVEGPGETTGLAKDPLLRRPFSIHQTSANGQLQIYFKVVGRGTDMLARVKAGEIVSIFGPLGRGFQIKKNFRHYAFVPDKVA